MQLLNYKSNFQKLLGAKNVKLKVIMTSHNCLQLSPIFHKIHMVKDKNFIKFELSAKW
jgi:hypothetical protein